MEIKLNTQQLKITFHDYRPWKNIPSDSNCGIYTICNALNDNKINNITTIADLLHFLNLSIPNYWYFGITYFREYLWGRKFTVFCENINLQYYYSLKIPSAKIAKLTMKLLDFDFKIIYKKEEENKVIGCNIKKFNQQNK